MAVQNPLTIVLTNWIVMYAVYFSKKAHLLVSTTDSLVHCDGLGDDSCNCLAYATSFEARYNICICKTIVYKNVYITRLSACLP